jgi:hypothetical protein
MPVYIICAEQFLIFPQYLYLFPTELIWMVLPYNNMYPLFKIVLLKCPQIIHNHSGYQSNVSDEFIFTIYHLFHFLFFLNFSLIIIISSSSSTPTIIKTAKHTLQYYITITVDSRVYKLETLPVAPSFIQSFVDMYQFFYPHYF